MSYRRSFVLSDSYAAQFDAAAGKVTQERSTIYGHPADDFARIAHMAEAIQGCKQPVIRHGLYMILAKVARLVETPDHLDSIIDIMGYARCLALIVDRENGRAI